MALGACLWLTLTWGQMLQRQTDSQPDGKPDWYLERTAFNEMHNQIGNCRQPAIGVIPRKEKSIQRLRCTKSAISLCSVRWFEFTVRINAIQRFRFSLWLSRLWLIIQRVFSNLCSECEYKISPYALSWWSNLKKWMSCTCTVLSHVNVKMKFFVITKEKHWKSAQSFYSLFEDESFVRIIFSHK